MKNRRITSRLLALSLLLSCAVALAVPSQQPEDARRAQEHLARGVEHLQAQELDDAIDELRKALDRVEDFPAAHYYLGVAHVQREEFEAGFRHLARAAELDPGNGEAHWQACRAAWFGQDFDNAWSQCILAAQAGKDVAGAFPELEKMSTPPAGYRDRVSAPRIHVLPPDIEALLGGDDSIFQSPDRGPERQGADERGGGVNANPLGNPGVGGGGGGGTRTTADSAATFGDRFSAVSGNSLAAQVQADLAELRRRFTAELAASAELGVVKEESLAQYLMLIEVDEVAPDTPRKLVGYLKLLDPGSAAEVYSRPLELDNIASVSDLRADVARYVGYLEQWSREQAGRQ